MSERESRDITRREAVKMLGAGAGLGVLWFSLWIAGSTLAQVVFYAGVVRALCGPLWTGLLSPWLEESR